MSNREKPRNVREAGKQLETEYILEGSVLRSGRLLRINVLLVRVRAATGAGRAQTIPYRA